VFEIILKMLERFEINYWLGWNVRCLTQADQVIMLFMKLRLGLPDMDLADRFGVSTETVRNVVYTYSHALHEMLFEGIIEKLGMPSQRKCRGSMPASFSDFAQARIATDCTEIEMEIPTFLSMQNETYSGYTHKNSAKGLTAVAPNAALVFASKLYPGSKSDKAIIIDCNIFGQLDPGDMVLADKGMDCHELMPTGTTLNIPPFLKDISHFTKQQAELCYKIARNRIHVERGNKNIKLFRIFRIITHTYRPLATKWFQLCCALVNLQPPLLKEIARKYKIDL